MCDERERERQRKRKKERERQRETYIDIKKIRLDLDITQMKQNKKTFKKKTTPFQILTLFSRPLDNTDLALDAIELNIDLDFGGPSLSAKIIN